mmetsp:Transcript_8436/g.18951  ORF Transcript_8436/g.18951 Transcript_8436/m.18951 type:complete len:253 (-) Transcript_8436:644-1402(-)
MKLSTALVLSFASSAVAFSPTPSHINRSDILPHRSTSATSLSMALTLYGSQGSRSPLCNWGADELGIPISMGDLRENPHPFKQIPCLTDDDDVLVFESGAILNYLQSKADEKEATKDASRSAAITSWIAWANASLDPICFLETPQGKVYDTGLKSANPRIDRLDQLLSKSTYLVKGEFSLADVAVASYLLYVIQFFPDVDLHSKWPNIVRYMKDCAAREAYGKAFGANVQGFCLERLGDMQSGDKKKLFGVF